MQHSNLVTSRICVLIFAALFIALASSCRSLQTDNAIPDFYRYDREGIIFHTDVAIESELISKMTNFKNELSHFFGIDQTPEIEIFLFSDRDHLNKYVNESRPHYPNRRAFYVRSGNHHRIYAHLDQKIETDLRHELTHVFVQAYKRDVPLWLDEGLAEYFEVVPSQSHINEAHLIHLAELQNLGRWTPNHKLLSGHNDPISFSQTNYAESWLWVHWMMQKFQQQPTFEDLLHKYSGGVLTALAGMPTQMDLQPFAEEVNNHFDTLKR